MERVFVVMHNESRDWGEDTIVTPVGVYLNKDRAIAKAKKYFDTKVSWHGTSDNHESVQVLSMPLGANPSKECYKIVASWHLEEEEEE